MKEPIIIRKPLSNEDYELMNDLRRRVFKKPLNQLRETETDSGEQDSYPFIVTFNEKVIATAFFQKNSNEEGQVRDLAVEKDYRNQRFASILMRYIEGFAISLGIKNIVIKTIKTLKEFFEKLDYEVIGEDSLFSNEIEQFFMSKKLI